MSIKTITVTNDDDSTQVFVDATTVTPPTSPEVITVPLDTPIEIHAA